MSVSSVFNFFSGYFPRPTLSCSGILPMTKASGQGCCVVLVALSVCHYAYVTTLSLTLVGASFAYLISEGSYLGVIFLCVMFFDFS